MSLVWCQVSCEKLIDSLYKANNTFKKAGYTYETVLRVFKKLTDPINKVENFHQELIDAKKALEDTKKEA
jgi:hypothetical protein